MKLEHIVAVVAAALSNFNNHLFLDSYSSVRQPISDQMKVVAVASVVVSMVLTATHVVVVGGGGFLYLE